MVIDHFHFKYLYEKCSSQHEKTTTKNRFSNMIKIIYLDCNIQPFSSSCYSLWITNCLQQFTKNCQIIQKHASLALSRVLKSLRCFRGVNDANFDVPIATSLYVNKLLLWTLTVSSKFTVRKAIVCIRLFRERKYTEMIFITIINHYLLSFHPQ